MSGENQKTVLLVEDDVLLAWGEKRTLEEYGYKVITAKTGEAAVEIVKKTPGIDLLLMDINLGAGIDGTEAAEIILREHDVPVVFLSGHAEPEIVEKTEKITSYGYIVKGAGDTILQASIKMAFKLFEAKKKEEEKEEALRESLERFELANRATFNAIWDWNLRTDKLWWNENFKPLFGFPAEETEPGIESWTRRIHPEDLDRVTTSIHAAIDSGKQSWSDHYRFRRKDGSFAGVDDRGYISRDEDGQPVRMIGAMQDITERLRAEDKLNALLREKELLLKEVHHRIKNNMSSMISLLSLQIKDLKSPEAVAALLKARNRLRSMGVLYDKLYHTENLREMSTKDYLSPLIDEIVGVFPNRSMVKIKKRICDIVLGVRVLPPLGIIVNELITNAMKHAFAGREDGSISVSASAKDNHVTLIIEDNGKGIPESVDMANPSGFGLQLVGRLTAQLDGIIRIEREKGTRFVLEFDA